MNRLQIIELFCDYISTVTKLKTVKALSGRIDTALEEKYINLKKECISVAEQNGLCNAENIDEFIIDYTKDLYNKRNNERIRK